MDRPNIYYCLYINNIPFVIPPFLPYPGGYTKAFVMFIVCLYANMFQIQGPHIAGPARRLLYNNTAYLNMWKKLRSVANNHRRLPVFKMEGRGLFIAVSILRVGNMSNEF